MGIELKECPVCTKVFEVFPKNCDNCGYDFINSQEEAVKMRADYMLMVSDLREAHRRLRTAGIVVFASGIISLIMAFLYYFEVNNYVFISVTATGIISILCFFLVKTRPVISTLVPLIFVIANNVLQILFAFSQYARLTTINVLVIACLIYCLRSALKANKIIKNHGAKYDPSKVI